MDKDLYQETTHYYPRIKFNLHLLPHHPLLLLGNSAISCN